MRQISVRSLLATTILTTALFTSGCSLFQVYKIDLPQGTPITQPQAQQIQVGMSKGQVVYLLGSPAFKDTLAPNRWDYLYDYEAGTHGKREGKPNIHDGSQHFVVIFDNQGRVSQISNPASLPKS